MFRFASLSLLLALNAWMTFRVSKAPGKFIQHKRLLITSIWLLPILGAFAARNELRTRIPGETFRSQQKRLALNVATDPAPVHLSVASSAPLAIRALVTRPGGLPVLDWEVARRWADSIADPEQRRRAVDMWQRAWLLHVRDALGPSFTLYVSQGASIVGHLEPWVAEAMADLVRKTHDRCSHLLGYLAAPAEPNYRLIVFSDDESYRSYLSSVEAKGENSGGKLINNECSHFATTRDEWSCVEPILIREIARSMLTWPSMPLWLSEGLSGYAEHHLTGKLSQAPTLQSGFWDEREIQAFWSGEVFFRDDDGALLASDLSVTLVQHLVTRFRGFQKFAEEASRTDAGARAARDHLGVDLGALTCALIGLEPSMAWSPKGFAVV